MCFLPGVDASHVYVRALALGCFYSHISTRTFQRALTASLDSCAEIKECPFSGVTKSGRVWSKVPESDARSVLRTVTTLHFLVAEPSDMKVSCEDFYRYKSVLWQR